MDGRCSTSHALPFVAFGWDAAVWKSSVQGTMERQECVCFHVEFLVFECLRHIYVP